MYELFTDRARKVFMLANQEATRWNCTYVLPEFILIGIVREGAGCAALALKKANVFDRVVQIVERFRERGDIGKSKSFGELPYHLPQTNETKKVVEYAMRASRELGHNYVGTEHILIGLTTVACDLPADSLACVFKELFNETDIEKISELICSLVKQQFDQPNNDYLVSRLVDLAERLNNVSREMLEIIKELRR